MSNLLATLGSSAGALQVFDQVLQVTQNNVSNAATPGYARQRLTLDALRFDLSVGAAGGVRSGDIQSARDQYAEQAVRRQVTLLGEAGQNVSSLSDLEAIFDISAGSGIPAALDRLFESFSAWAQSPNDAIVRQSVLDQAAAVAGAFQQTASSLVALRQDTDSRLQSTVSQIDELVHSLQDYNLQALRNAQPDPALDARIHATLEELAQYADITALPQADGSVTVLLNGQTPLLVGAREYPLSFALASPDEPAYPGRFSAAIVAYDGADVTAQASGGRLGALLDIRNRLLGGYLGDSSRPGDLNLLAKQFADRVNQLLTPVDPATGIATGVPLFAYDTTNDANVAQTLAVTLGDPGQLNPANPGPPPVANGAALALSALPAAAVAADRIDGMSYHQFFARMATRTGNALNLAKDRQTVQQSTVAQSRSLRQQTSGISLDEEATILIQFQRAYEANSRLITVLDQITREAIDILRP